MKLSRRELAALLAAAPALAMEQAPEDPGATAAEDARKNAEEVRKFKVPAGTEPAFAFKAL